MTIDTGSNSDSDSDVPTLDVPTLDVPTLKVRGPADLVQAIPYLLGFHPVGSLVLVGLERSRVMVTARLDLPDLALPALLADSVAGMYRGGAREFVAVIFDDDAVPHAVPHASRLTGSPPLPWHGAAAEVADVVEGVGGVIDDIVLVTRKRMWSYVCDEPTCCPPEGTALADSSAVAATATYAGLVALPDRASVARLLDPVPDADRDRLSPALRAGEQAAVKMILSGDIDRENRSVKRALFGACRAGDVPGATPAMSDAQIVRYALALRRYEVRDPLWLAVDDGRIDGRVVWRYLAQRVPGPFAAAPLFLFAWSSYRDGDGALAGMAAQRALESDSRYSAADLLLAALAHAVDPRRMPKLRSRRSA